MRTDPRGILVGTSASVERLRAILPRVATTDSGVLIIGEAGTGREHVARLIHETGTRRGGPFAVVGCPGYAGSEEFDELFGGQGRPGLLESCGAGSIYLASIDELPGAIQGKLARFVEDAAYGSVHAPRLIASARHDLTRSVAHGRFRGDLYYRLSVVTLRLPPLRERREDIPSLALHFLEETAAGLGKRFSGISDSALAVLLSHRWNGNLAELAAAIQRAAIIDPGPVLSADSLPPSIQPSALAVAS